MFSGLSVGTTRAKSYNHAAWNVACLAQAISLSGRPPSAYRSLGFPAPDGQITSGMFTCVGRASRGPPPPTTSMLGAVRF